MKLKTITARQCKQARALLKWNLHDLASRTNIPFRHLERFERNLTRLSLPENMEVKQVCEKNGVVFCDNLDVILVDKEEGADEAMTVAMEADADPTAAEDDETEEQRKRRQKAIRSAAGSES